MWPPSITFKQCHNPNYYRAKYNDTLRCFVEHLGGNKFKAHIYIDMGDKIVDYKPVIITSRDAAFKHCASQIRKIITPINP